MSLATIREGVAAGVAGFEFTDGKLLRCPAYITEEMPTPVAMFDFEVGEPIAFDGAKRDTILIVQLYDQRDSERGAQIRLDEARDHSSNTGLPDVVEGLAVTGVDFLRYLTASRITETTVAGGNYLTVELRFQVVF